VFYAAMFIVVLAGALALFYYDVRVGAHRDSISIGLTETMETFNPYGDSVCMYSVWCRVLGCLAPRLRQNQPVGLLVERGQTEPGCSI
jgi:hypothetical protein